MALGSLAQHFSQYPVDSWPRTSVMDDITINAEPYIVILTEISPLRLLASPFSSAYLLQHPFAACH